MCKHHDHNTRRWASHTTEYIVVSNCRKVHDHIDNLHRDEHDYINRSENYYLIILQYKHTYNNNKAQLLIFIKDIMYYTMDPSCANPETKMYT
jgi:hypothetical protein